MYCIIDSNMICIINSHMIYHTNTKHVIKHRSLLSRSMATASSTSSTASSTASMADQADVFVASRTNLQHALQQLVAHDAPGVLGRSVLQRRLVLVELDLQERRTALLAALLHHVDVVDVGGEPNDHIAFIAAQLPIRTALHVQNHHSVASGVFSLLLVVRTTTLKATLRAYGHTPLARRPNWQVGWRHWWQPMRHIPSNGGLL